MFLSLGYFSAGLILLLVLFVVGVLLWVLLSLLPKCYRCGNVPVVGVKGIDCDRCGGKYV